MAWALRTGSGADDATGYASTSASFTASVTLGATTVSGDRIILLVCGANATTAPTFAVSDGTNGSYHEDFTQSTTDGVTKNRLSVFSVSTSSAAAPSITVTITNSGGGNCFGGMIVAAYSGLSTSAAAAVDVSVGTSGSSNAAASGNTAATTGPNELVIGAYSDPGYGTTVTKGASYTLLDAHQSDGGNWQGLYEYKDSGASGTTEAADTSQGASTGWNIACVVYKLSGGAAPIPIEPPMRTLRGVGI